MHDLEPFFECMEVGPRQYLALIRNVCARFRIELASIALFPDPVPLTLSFPGDDAGNGVWESDPTVSKFVLRSIFWFEALIKPHGLLGVGDKSQTALFRDDDGHVLIRLEIRRKIGTAPLTHVGQVGFRAVSVSKYSARYFLDRAFGEDAGF